MKNDDIPLRKYCDADYRDMQPDEGVARRCERCETPVHDLSQLSRAEAGAFLEEKKGHACVRYLYDDGGRVIFKDAPPRILPPAWLVRAGRAAAIAAAVLSPTLLEACGPPAKDDSGDDTTADGGEGGSEGGAGGAGGAGGGDTGGGGASQ